jgi:hypothetical protein
MLHKLFSLVLFKNKIHCVKSNFKYEILKQKFLKFRKNIFLLLKIQTNNTFNNVNVFYIAK